MIRPKIKPINLEGHSPNLNEIGYLKICEFRDTFYKENGRTPNTTDGEFIIVFYDNNQKYDIHIIF